MTKKNTRSRTTQEIFDQIDRAREALESLTGFPLDDRGEFQSGSEVRSRLNAAKAHVGRAIEKAQMLR